MNEVQILAGLVAQLVRGMQPVTDVGEHVGCERSAELRARLGQRLEHARERLPLHVLHREEQLAVDLSVVVRAHDVRVVEHRRQLGLAQEHLDASRISRRVGQESLERDDALVPVGPPLGDRALRLELERCLDGAHAAPPDHEERPIPRREPGSGRCWPGTGRRRGTFRRARRRRCEVARGHPRFIVA